jgi:polysaccharide biosynthesis protein PslH
MAQPKNSSNIKILSVVWYKVLPPIFGGQKAVALFNDNLGKLVSLSCLCSRNNEPEQVSYSIDNSLPVSKTQFLNPMIWWKICLVARKIKATHLILEFPYHGISGLVCKKILGIKLVINTHNIEYLRFREQGKWWSGLLLHFEKWILGKADLIFFKTEEDKQKATEVFHLEGYKVSTIPYGITVQDYSGKEVARQWICHQHNIDKEEKIMLFAGTLDYQPNADALIAIREQIIPSLKKELQDFKIIIMGRNRSKKFSYLNQRNDPHLIMLGEVDDIANYYLGADIFINPVLSGGGIQTKMMDALSYHLNVVCFQSKRSAITGADNKLFSVDDGDWKGFTAAIMKAFDNLEETPAIFFDIYNWRTIAARAFQKIASC